MKPATDELLYGTRGEERLVAVEHLPDSNGDRMALFFREGGDVSRREEPFAPFIVAEGRLLDGCPLPHEPRALEGNGPLNVLARVPNWKAAEKLRDWLSTRSGAKPSAPDAPYLFLNDPVQQHLISSGLTLFLGLRFEDLRRMQVDIECLTAPGFDFCNAARAEDRIVAIALSDSTGWQTVLSGAELDEPDLLRRFVETVRARDPDVIEGHNLFNFDLPYIAERAALHGVELALGRDGSVPDRRSGRVTFGERTLAYDRFDIFGRHVIDTYFLVQAYDISHRSLSGFGLKDVAVHFGVAAPSRTYVDGGSITREFERDPERVMRYCQDDALETRGVSDLLSRPWFFQAQLLPFSYQNVAVRGTGTRIDALLIREYLRQGHALPTPGAARTFSGGYTDMFVEGLVHNVHHCDVRSLYPSLMLSRHIAPACDDLDVFLKLLQRLRDFRVEAKDRMTHSRDAREKADSEALQSTLKVLINSFYGYLGFSQARFADFDAAERVAAEGRELLRAMIAWLKERGAQVVEIDTDGIYFVPPPGCAVQAGKPNRALEEFRKAFAGGLPEGIEIEFDGEYRSMFSYKMKNYALLGWDGEMVVKGAALKSRGLEPFQREFLEELLRLKLEGRDHEATALRKRFADAISGRRWEIARLAKTERLQDAPSTYRAKVGGGNRARNAAYELALKAARTYRAGDQVAYYVAGTRKNVAVHEAAKLTSDWDPANRDENVPYYLAKLDALCEKFGVPVSHAAGAQGELGL
jgi:DNA polymerase I